MVLLTKMEGRSMKQHHKKKRESNHNGAIDENEIPRFKKRQAGSLNSTNSKILRQKGFQDKSDALGGNISFRGNKSDRGGERKHLQDKSDELARTNAFKGKSDEGSGRKRFQDKSDERGRAHGFKDNSDVSGRKNDFRERSDSSRPKSGFEKSDAVHHNKAFQEKFPRLNRNTGFENKSDLRGGRKDFKHKSDEWGRKDSFENKSDLVGRKKAFQDKSDVLGRKNGFNNNRDAGGGKKDFQHKGDQLGQKNSFENKYDGVDRRKSFHDMSDTTGRKKGTKDKFDDVENRPKREKKAMRIDPNDISNKRLDDGISFDGKVVEKKVDPEKNVELSKNAQFRAIQPDPSILSFVEDNLLGRRRLIELRRAGYNIEVPAPLDNIPGSTSSERERVEEPVFGNKLTFFAAAKVASSFPPPELPEIAFAGRSNVGKSSLLNALTRQWGVVRTSDKPGLTQTINFFNLGQKFSLVDLPGYGFAYAKEEVKDAWEELVKEYVSTRVGIKQVCLLIDTKWGMKPRDHELIDLMERSQTKYQIVLTKTDVVFPIDVARRAMQIEQTLKANKSVVQPVMMVSSKSGAGIRSLRTVLSKIMRFAKV